MTTLSIKMLQTMLASNSEEAINGVRKLSRYISGLPLNQENVILYLKIFKKNDSQAVDLLLNKREPFSLFSILKPSRLMITESLAVLIEHKAEQLDLKILLCCLGVLKNSYMNQTEGYRLYQLSLSDIYHISKFLLSNLEQKQIIIDLLDNIRHSSYTAESQLSLICKNIIDHYYDPVKKIADIIPAPILKA